MSKFSNGPWITKEQRDSCVIENTDETYIADVHFWTEGGRDITRANAALIAAAPEMYDALEQVLNSSKPDWDLVINVLKKARGE